MTNKFTFALLFSILICFQLQAQSSYKAIVKDKFSNEALTGSTAILKGTTTGASADENGYIVIENIPDGKHIIIFSFVGYKSYNDTIILPTNDIRIIHMEHEAEEIDEIIIEATRSNRSIQNIPTRIEALTEEIDEASTMDPSKIAHLITHSTGIQVQQTSATSNTANVRIQGLDGRYAQMLKDGFPLYGGFSGSLSIMQIPPLDLRQVEYIKGSASTLYGGGAISGLINLISKDPDKEETLLHVNYSNIGARDINSFFSRKFDKWGLTMLANYNLHNAFDADDDGYSDMPEIEKFNFNPKLFYYLNSSTKFYLGGTFTKEHRAGGDLNLLNNKAPNSLNFYRETNNSTRNTTQFKFDKKFDNKHSLTIKNSVNFFDRFLEINENVNLDKAVFSGNQTSTFTEAAYNFRGINNNLTVGSNYITDNFKENEIQSASIGNEKHETFGFFLNHLWDATKWLSFETGVRTDYNQNYSSIGADDGTVYFLPRLNALFKITSKLTSRIGGGLGYRPASIFNQEAEMLGYKNILPINYLSVSGEKSYGGNFDIGYKSQLRDNILISLNQLVFYTSIKKPLVLTSTANKLLFKNLEGNIESKGFETQLKLTVTDFTLFVGYTYTNAVMKYNGSNYTVPLTPTHSIKGDLLYSLPDKWRIGWDYEYKSAQTLSNNLKTKSLFMTGLVVERTIKNFVLFVNFENFTDVRQSRYESLNTSPYNTPQYTEVWAPLDGFVWNTGLKIKL